MDKIPPRFEQVMKSFLGFLVGTKKSALTVSSYRSDLLVFQEFLRAKKLAFGTLNAKDLDGYQFFLIKRGLKINTRRRKLLTARAIYRYALSRKKIALSPAQFLKTPARREVLPWIPTRQEVNDLIQAVPAQSSTGRRNRAMLHLLAETGMSLSEICALRWENLNGRNLSVGKKRPRELRISASLLAELLKWQSQATGKFVFPGFNRHGIFTQQMTPRGVELWVKTLATQADLPQFKPKSFRHFAILHWLHESVSEIEILRRLGVRRAYPLAPYREYLRKMQKG
jgi:site-specific recombinase XerD